MDLNLIGSRRVNAYAVLILLSGLLALPSLAQAGSGGGSLSPSGGASTVQSGNVTVSASGDGITLTTNASAILSRGLTFSGTTSPSEAGQTIEIERLGHQTDSQWAPTVTTTVAGDGSFSAVWSTNHIGRFEIRAVFAGASAGAASAPPLLTTTVYRQARATIYGPGFYGRRTACGERLTRATIGVANPTLKCGTKVALYFQGRTMIVPVIDRGPYANGADWDLTTATARALEMPGTESIGAVSLPLQPSAALTPLG